MKATIVEVPAMSKNTNVERKSPPNLAAVQPSGSGFSCDERP
jgi:hypothetical protein